MKRIISLILVAVMALTVFTGCAYKYSDDDMTKYASFDVEAFKKALADSSIVVKDGDFGIGKTDRAAKVLDAIFTELAKKATDELKEGTPDAYDILYYAYYATDADGNIFNMDKMAVAKKSNIQLSLSTLEDLNKAIADAMAGKNIKDYLYSTKTEGETKAGDTIVVSYNLEYVDYVRDEEGNIVVENGLEKTQTKKITVSNQIIVLPADNDNRVPSAEPHIDSFIDKLISTEESKVTVGGTALSFNIDWVAGDKGVDVRNEGEDTKGEYKYTGVKVNYIVESMNELVDGGIKDTTYTETTKVKDIYGTEHDLKDKELFYHVFPVSYCSVANELTSDIVLREFAAALIATEVNDEGETVYSVDFVEEDVYKNGDVKLVDYLIELKKLVDSLNSAEDALKKAQTELDSKQKIVDQAGGADKATETQKANLAKAKEDRDNALKTRDEAKDKFNYQVNSVYGCTAEGKDLKKDIVDGYITYRYDTLEKSYKNALKNSVAEEIYKLAKKFITFKVDENGWNLLPRKAVNDAYKRYENNLKYEFHEGNYTESSSSSSSSSSSVTNYVKYAGDYNAYLRAELGLKKDATNQDIKDAIGAKAEAAVKDIILVYVLAGVYGADVAVTDEDIDEFKNTWQYWLLTYQVGEDNVDDNDFIHAIQLDNVLNYLLEEKSVSEEEATEGLVEYAHVKYTIEEEGAQES